MLVRFECTNAEKPCQLCQAAGIECTSTEVLRNYASNAMLPCLLELSAQVLRLLFIPNHLLYIRLSTLISGSVQLMEKFPVLEVGKKRKIA
ncbi:hypothetical protein DUNSADRAFT_1349 [Dunaliella salina]|uniref:Zn(2)-C6 fungal-type domain-containing protein n=1 Tax=Dunaliella salina TaxID=3046 RepID=A0ABQ7GX78_DUNSA|nr:hypothetical protein DUNSADRAFT_1349 [Dunaliella salina]|eukprot:KAF5839213.1 hypothetical protein DUNSADRAFT_1349 [Dunaliella salina]